MSLIFIAGAAQAVPFRISNPFLKLCTNVTGARLSLGAIENVSGSPVGAAETISSSIQAGLTVTAFAAPALVGLETLKKIDCRWDEVEQYQKKLDEQIAENPLAAHKKEAFEKHYLKNLKGVNASGVLQASMIFAAVPTEIVAGLSGDAEIFYLTWLTHMAIALGGYMVEKQEHKALHKVIRFLDDMEPKSGEENL